MKPKSLLTLLVVLSFSMVMSATPAYAFDLGGMFNNIINSIPGLAPVEETTNNGTANVEPVSQEVIPAPAPAPVVAPTPAPKAVTTTVLSNDAQVLQPAAGYGYSNTISISGTNLIKNSSFETELSTKPRLWNYQLSSDTGNTYRSNEGIRSGSYGLKIKGGGTGTFGLSQPLSKTTSGRTYTLSAYVKAVNTAKPTFKLGFWDEYGNKYGTMKSFSFSGTKDWSRVSVTVTTPGLITDVKNWFPILEVSGLTTGNFYVDDVQMEESNMLTNYNTAWATIDASSSQLGGGSVIVNLTGDIYPSQSAEGNLGTSSSRFNNLYLAADANISGDIAVNGHDITSDGNLTINSTGYIRVGEDGTPGIVTGNNDLYVQGNTELDGTLGIGGNVTLDGDLAVNGGDITSTAATFNFIAASSTTLNIGGVADSTINIGDAANTETIEIGGVTSDGTNTIRIATNATSADAITIGNNNASTTVAITGGDDWNMAATGVLTMSASADATTAIVATDTNYTNALSVGDNSIIGTTGLIDYTNFDVLATGNITVAGGVGLDTNAAGILALGNVTATTVNIGGTAATTLNLGAGGALGRAVNIGTGTGIDTIQIGGGATVIDAITIGDILADVTITDDDWSVTNAGIITTTGLANLDGGIAVDTNNFTVSGTTGSTAIVSSAVTGNLLAVTLDAAPITGATIGLSVDLSPITGGDFDKTGVAVVGDDSGTGVSTGFTVTGTVDYGLDTDGATVNTADIRMENSNTIANSAAGTVTIDATTLQTAAGATIQPSAAGTLAVQSSGVNVLTLDAGGAAAVNIGNTNANAVSICNSDACDTITIGSNADADTITIGDATDTAVSINDDNWSVDVAGAATFTSIDVNGSIANITGDVTFDTGASRAISIASAADNSAITLSVVGGASSGAGNTGGDLILGGGAPGAGGTRGAVIPNSANNDNLGKTGTRWGTLFANTVNFLTSLTDSGAGTPTVNLANVTAANMTLAASAIEDADVIDSLTISGGTVNNSVIGGVTPAAGTFTDLTASNLANLNGGIAVDTDNFTVSGTTGAVGIVTAATTGNVIGVTADAALATGVMTGLSVDFTGITGGAFAKRGISIVGDADGAATTALLVSGSVDYGLDLNGTTVSGADIRLKNANTIANGAAGTITMDVTTLQTAAGSTIQPSADGAISLKSNTAGAVTVDSAASGDVNLGNGNNAKAINIGTGTAGNTIHIGDNDTTKDTITLGSIKDDVAVASDSWNITNAGVASGFAGFTSTGTVDFSAATMVRLPRIVDDAYTVATTPTATCDATALGALAVVDDGNAVGAWVWVCEITGVGTYAWELVGP